MKKLFLLAMVLFFGFALSPVLASGLIVSDGMFIGLASELTMTTDPVPLGVQQLGTFMETLLAVGIGLLVYSPLRLLVTCPATNAPERYDKVRSLDLFAGLRKLMVNRQNAGRLKRQSP